MVTALLDDIYVMPLEVDGRLLDLVATEGKCGPGCECEDCKCGGEGGKPGPCPEGDKPEAKNPKEAARSLADKIKELPKKVYTRAKEQAVKYYKKAEGRYGRKMAIAIMGAGIAGSIASGPIPGGGFVAAAPLLAAGELYLRLHKGKAEALSQEEIDKLGKEWVEELLADWKENHLPDFQPQKAIKADHKLPEKLTDILKAFFKRQCEHVLAKVGAQEKSLAEHWLDIDQWDKDLAHEVMPVVQILWDDSAQDTITRLGADPDLFAVVQPNLREGVKRASFLFAESTNQTTSLELGAAIDALKDELAEGLEAGEYKNALAKRVQGVFERADNDRAFTIAVTEASRAQHAAMRVTADASDVVTGYRWILSDDACPECMALYEEKPTVKKGEAFATGEGPYGVVDGPPLHPRCRCTMVETTDLDN